MRRSIVALVAAVGLVVLLVGPVSVSRLAVETAAQVATPPAAGIEVTCGFTPANATPEVVTVETAAGEAVISCGVVSNEPGEAAVAPFLVVDEVALPSPASFTFSRDTLAPGEVWPAVPDDPTLALIAVEAGALTVRAAAAMEVAREGGMQESVAAGTAVILAPGDLAFIPPGGGGELRNDGTEPAVALLTIIGPMVAFDAAGLGEACEVEAEDEDEDQACPTVPEAGEAGTPASTP